MPGGPVKVSNAYGVAHRSRDIANRHAHKRQHARYAYYFYSYSNTHGRRHYIRHRHEARRHAHSPNRNICRYVHCYLHGHRYGVLNPIHRCAAR
jgi:hypothetical protein